MGYVFHSKEDEVNRDVVNRFGCITNTKKYITISIPDNCRATISINVNDPHFEIITNAFNEYCNAVICDARAEDRRSKLEMLNNLRQELEQV